MAGLSRLGRLGREAPRGWRPTPPSSSAMRSTARSRTARSASLTALAMPSALELPWATTATPRRPSRIAPPTRVRVHARAEAAERGSQQQPARGRDRAGARGAADRVADRARGALQRLQGDVAGEAVGDDDVGRPGEQVAALDVADELDPVGRGQALVGRDHVGVALLLLLADREQGDPGPLRRRGPPRLKAEPMKANWTRCCGPRLGVGADIEEEHGALARPAPAPARRARAGGRP